MFEKIIPLRARLSPTAPAIWTEAGEVGFRRLNSDIERVAARIAAEDLSPTSVALVDIPSIPKHLLMLLALERCGLVSVTAPFPADPAGLLSLIRPAVIITERPETVANADVRVLALDQAWWRDVFAQEERAEPDIARSPDDLVRIVLSSGTTGEPKKIPITRRDLDKRLANVNFAPSPPRTLSMIGLDTIGGYRTPSIAGARAGRWWRRLRAPPWRCSGQAST